jgi:two-component system cell cycle sensor histidine kinase/response regulator CckA
LRRQSIDRRLLVFVTVLLLATVTAFSVTAYRQVETVALTTAGERLQSASIPIVQLLAASAAAARQMLARTANDPAVRWFVTTGEGRDDATRVLTAAVPESDRARGRRELRDIRGTVLTATTGSVAPTVTRWTDSVIASGTLKPGDVRIGPLQSKGDSAYVQSLVAVGATKGSGGPDSSRVVGYLTSVALVAGRGLETIRALVGPNAVILVGSPGGGVWTDLEHTTPPPPAGIQAGKMLIFDSSPRGAGVGAASSIPGTPWVLWVQQPRSTLLAMTRGLVMSMAGMAVFFIVAGAVAAALLGKRITGPIVRLTEAAEHLAADATTQPRSASGDEVERLTDAFNRMSGRVAESHQALTASEQRFRALIENAADPIAILDRAAVVRYASPAYVQVIGAASHMLVEHAIADRVHPDDRDALGATIADLLAQPSKTIGLTFRVRHAGGTWRTLAGSATNLLDQPAIAGIVLNARDVTDRLALEAQLRHAQKMEAIGRLAGGIAHDLNNILTAITSFSQFAADTVPPHSQARDDIHQVELAAQRATALTKQLLAFSRQQVLQPRPLDLNEVVSGLESMLRRLIRADIELAIRLGASGIVMADPAQLEQVLLNLVINAGDAMPNGGALTIQTGEAELGDDYVQHHAEAQPGPHVVLAVTDTGFGMDADTQARIFEPFFTTKALGVGTGLGLSTVYGIVKQSGGSIWVYSEIGRGTTFKIYLPRHAGAAAAHRAEPRPSAPTMVSAIVLLVEDDAGVRMAARRALEAAGYTVHSAATGREALALGKQLPAPPDLVITDLVMPDMGGRELALRIGERWPSVPILYTSGYTAEAMGQQSVLHGDDMFIEKPFTPRALVDKANTLVHGGQARDAGRRGGQAS